MHLNVWIIGFLILLIGNIVGTLMVFAFDDPHKAFGFWVQGAATGVGMTLLYGF